MQAKDVERYLCADASTPRGRASSVRYSDVRFRKALEQAQKDTVEIDKISTYVNEFLMLLGIPPVENPRFDLSDNWINYDQVMKDDGLADVRNIIWMKFTSDNYLGVVAKSNDINFDIPQSEEEYTAQHNKKWIHNTSGIIVHHLGKKWDNSFALVFPLQHIPNNLNSGSLETGIGNYLIDKGVPILDYYSHNY